jgi:glycosyltransferase XagB
MKLLLKKNHSAGHLIKLGLLLFFIFLYVGAINLIASDSHVDQKPLTSPSMAAPATREQALVMLANLYDKDAIVPDRAQDSSLLVLASNQVIRLVDDFQHFVLKPRPTETTIFVVLLLLFLIPQGIFTMLWMLYAWNDPDKADQGKSPREFYQPQYSFTALVPARHEEAVIKDTIYAVNAIDYPAHLKEILILVRDENDEGTIAKVNEAIAELANTNIRLITFKEGPKNKPNGLNRGLHVATKDVVCIFDAEDEPHPAIYNIVNTVMLRDEADVVQSGVQLMNIDSTWFSALNCLEYFFWFRSGLHFFTNMLHVTPLGGNTVFFKRSWLNRTGGWDEQLLTEDADIGIRMTLQGARLRIVYDPQHVTQEETPATTGEFVKQRTRWSQGFYEILFKFDWWQLKQFRQKIGAMYILMNPFFQASLMFYLPVGLYIFFIQKINVALAIAAYIPLGILLIQLLLNLAGILEFAIAYEKRLPRFFILKMLAAFYPFQLMLAAASLRAAYRFLKGQHAWEKTTHSNVHRTPVSVQRERV